MFDDLQKRLSTAIGRFRARGLPAALSQSASVLLWTPTEVGLNDAVIEHALPGDQLDPSVHVVLHTNEPVEQMAGPVHEPSRRLLTT